MTSWKLSLLLLLALVVVIAVQVEGNRGGRRRQNNNGAVARRRGGRRRGGSNVGVSTDDGDDDDSDSGLETDGNMGGPRRRGGRRRGGRGRGHGRGHGRRGGRGRGAGGRRGGGGRRRPGALDPERLLQDYSLSNGNFGLSMYREMTKNADNFAISPLSIHSALSMLLLGASGQTKRQLIRGLHIRSPIHPAFQVYNQSLDHGAGENATLMMANALYTKQGVSFKRRFMSKLRAFYNSATSTFDANDPEGVINNWVSSKTMEMIPDFLSDGEVTDDMIMMLINAIYFKGLWEDEFDEEDTSLRTFTDANNQDHDVYMMSREGFYNMYQSTTLGASAIKIPYKGGRYSLNLFLPNEDTDLTTMETRLTHEHLNATLHMLQGDRGTKVYLSMPKFRMDTEKSMKELLQAVGINNVFESSATFRRMTRSNNVKVSKVKHRCVMEVDEEGTEAAAVTGIGIVMTSMSLPFEANRPFMFILRDDQRSVNLFMGRYVDPQGDNLAE